MVLPNFEFRFNSIVLVKSLENHEVDTSTVLKEFIEGNEGYNTEVFKLLQIEAHNAEGFKTLVNDLIAPAKQGMRPILNLDCHGNERDGLIFKDDSVISWEELAECLRPLNQASQFNLIVILSCCFGAHFMSGLGVIQAAPCAFIVAPTHEINSGEIIAGLFSFYDSLFKTFNIVQAVLEARRRTLTDGDWYAEFAALWYIEVVNGYLKTYCTKAESRKRVEELFQKHKADGNTARYGRTSMSGIKRAMAEAHRIGLITKYFDTYFMIDKLPETRARFEQIRKATEEQINELKRTGQYLI